MDGLALGTKIRRIPNPQVTCYLEHTSPQRQGSAPSFSLPIVPRVEGMSPEDAAIAGVRNR